MAVKIAVALERDPRIHGGMHRTTKGRRAERGPATRAAASTHAKVRARLPSRRTLSSSRLYVMTDRVWEQSAATSTKSLPVMPKVQSMVPGCKRECGEEDASRDIHVGTRMEGRGKKEHGEVGCARLLEVMYRGTSDCALPESPPAAAPDSLA